MASKELHFNITGDSRGAVKALGRVGNTSTSVMRTVGRSALVIGAAVTGIVVRFGYESVKAAADAETQQNKLTAAWEKFPKTADLSLAALRRYNTELAKKTKFDDDTIASGQAVLAQFKLTGAQIKQVTPLLLDYAARTGKDLPTAAQDLGKALLGQGRALKGIGINFKDTGTASGNFQELIKALSEQVGGFAEKEGETAAGKLEILKNRFGEVEEKIGTALMPALSDLIDFTNDTVIPGLEGFSGWFTETGLPAIQDAVKWVGKYKDILGPAAVALGTLTAAQWLLNAAMDANPVGLVILGLAALVTAGTAVATNFGNVQGFILKVTYEVQKAFSGAIIGFSSFVEGAINTVIDGINGVLGALGIGKLSHVDMTSALISNWSKTSTVLQAGIAGGFSAGNNALNLINAGGASLGGGGGAGGVGHKVAGSFASGGIVPPRPGGWWANVGEGGQAEAIIPLNRLGGMGGGTHIHLHMEGGFVGDKDQLAKAIFDTIVNGMKRGAIPRTISITR